MDHGSTERPQLRLKKNISKSPASYTAKDPHQGQTFGADVPKAPSYKAALSDPNYRKMFYGKPLMQRLKEDAAKDPTDQLTEFVTRENQKAAQQEAQTDRVIAQDLPKIMQANKDIKNPSSYAPTVLLDRRRPNKPFSPTALRGQPEDWYTYGTGRYDLQDNMFGRGRKDVPVSRLTIKGPYQLYRKSGLLEKLRQLRTLKGLDPYQR